ncbi:MAG TPA: hypothetical protein PLG99_07855 [Kaistiaceae bacterium]|nr:hypothetical protein [Kaistiaceae bacterium]
MLLAVPLLILPLIAYNLVVNGAVAGGGVDALGAAFLGLDMMSGARFTLDLGDALVLFGIALLFVEILKATRTGAGSIADHLLSTALFIAYLVEFLMIEAAATSTFFILMVLSLVDVAAGYSVTIRSARRDFAVGPGGAL